MSLLRCVLEAGVCMIKNIKNRKYFSHVLIDPVKVHV